MKYYLIAGEASGDLHASNLMKALLQKDTEAQFRFFGGDMMSSVGGERVRHYRDLAYMGVWPVITHLGIILRSRKECFRDISTWHPDVVILIDYPGFNLEIARMVRSELGIPVYYYISPKIWAWKGYRIKNIRRDVDELFSILPFEVEFFRKHDYPIHYVGNPCVDAVHSYLKNADAVSLTGSGRPVLALLAGSRRQEIDRNLPMMLQAVSGIPEAAAYDLVLAGAPGIDPDFYGKYLKNTDVKVFFGKTYDILRAASAALVTSGTATLETCLFRVPQVVCYSMPCGKIVSAFRGRVLKVKFVSLVNLIAGREVVPELVAADMNVQNIRKELGPLLSDTATRKEQSAGYEEVISTLGPAGASEKAAEQMVELLQNTTKSR
ncbi:MAG: lipid-A-disaccharide synthase [Bacteroidaceae bacterium]|nr:lipid-A-disaccharide synthase [Bacteroidaceae bacterium]